jgi:LPS export ABC transporter protein LptC
MRWNNKVPVPLLLISILVLGGSGARSREKNNASTAQQTGSALPEYVLSNVRHYHYEDGTLRLETTFQKGEYYADTAELLVEMCEFLYYDKNKRVISRGSAQRAKICGNGSLIIAERDVRVISEVNGAVLETDYLEWHGEEERFSTESPVKITRKNGDTIAGSGMVADIALRFITIKRDVKGSVRGTSS